MHAICTYCGNLYDRPSVGFCSERHAELQRAWLTEPGHKTWNEIQAVRAYLYWWDHRTGDPQNVHAPDYGAAYQRWVTHCAETKVTE